MTDHGEASVGAGTSGPSALAPAPAVEAADGRPSGHSGTMGRPDPSPDAPLRANVRLLGEILGRVVTEQEGEDVYRLEERVRLLARLGRRGDAGASRALAETIAALDVETQAVVLRAFAVYFHLANIAEQHHRVRRRREHEREGGTPRESLAEALELLERDGVTREEIADAGARVSVELV